MPKRVLLGVKNKSTVGSQPSEANQAHPKKLAANPLAMTHMVIATTQATHKAQATKS